MHSLLKSLSGGHRRSIGGSNRIVLAVLAQPELLKVLFQGIESGDSVLRMRCADAAEKVTASRPELLFPHKGAVLHKLSNIEQPEVRWHIAPMLSSLTLSNAKRDKVLKTLLNFTNDQSSIVKTMSMQAMADIAARDPHLIPVVRRHVEELIVIGTPAMRALGRKLIRSLTKAENG
jgi:hypothetical protein